MHTGLQPGITGPAVVRVWREDELPKEEDIFIGEIARVYTKTPDSFSFWVKFDGLEQPIPADRVKPLDRILAPNFHTGGRK